MMDEIIQNFGQNNYWWTFIISQLYFGLLDQIKIMIEENSSFHIFDEKLKVEAKDIYTHSHNFNIVRIQERRSTLRKKMQW